MPREKIIYTCQSCGAQSPKWKGQCDECKDWNTLIEEHYTQPSDLQRSPFSEIKRLDEIELEKFSRLSSGFTEFDRVLGGGLVPGSVVLLGGDPGIGKSTLLIQILSALQLKNSTLYISGEESLNQIAERAKRLALVSHRFSLLAENQLETILAYIKKQKPQIVVVDSIQTIFSPTFSSVAGSLAQVRESVAQLVRYAKQTGTALLLVGHVTKEGMLAGPRMVEHMVDTVLYFEGDSRSRFRCIRAVKNRFGTVNELGVFAMTDKGLKEIANPSAIFLSRQEIATPGNLVMVAWEGTRPLLVEVQALVDTSYIASHPRRIAAGFENTRLTLLLAVLHRHANIALYQHDVFVNIVGGIEIVETAADLAVVLAIVSSLKNRPIFQNYLVFGEIGLGGEIRPVPSGQERLKEAVKHGFQTAIVPLANIPKKNLEGLKIIGVRTLQESLKALFNV